MMLEIKESQPPDSLAETIGMQDERLHILSVAVVMLERGYSAEAALGAGFAVVAEDLGQEEDRKNLLHFFSNRPFQSAGPYPAASSSLNGATRRAYTPSPYTRTSTVSPTTRLDTQQGERTSYVVSSEPLACFLAKQALSHPPGVSAVRLYPNLSAKEHIENAGALLRWIFLTPPRSTVHTTTEYAVTKTVEGLPENFKDLGKVLLAAWAEFVTKNGKSHVDRE